MHGLIESVFITLDVGLPDEVDDFVVSPGSEQLMAGISENGTTTKKFL